MDLELVLIMVKCFTSKEIYIFKFFFLNFFRTEKGYGHYFDPPDIAVKIFSPFRIFEMIHFSIQDVKESRWLGSVAHSFDRERYAFRKKALRNDGKRITDSPFCALRFGRT